MAKTIPESFRILRQRLEISGLQKEAVSGRQKNVRAAVEEGLTVLDSFLTGSYSRSTMISPLNEADIDIFVVLDSDYFHHYNGKNGGQGGLLDLVKRTLRKTYPKTPSISRNGQAVTITFTDFKVDVVPGFYRNGGGYLIPNSVAQRWISTDPKRHVEIFSEANRTHDSDLVPLVKMVKGWNTNITHHFHSFHLEVLALEILNGVTISDFPSGMRYYFDKGRSHITQKNLDPAGYGGDVGAYLDNGTKVQNAKSRFETAYTRAHKAEEYAKQGRVEDSVNEWRKVLGNYFPAYG